MSKRPRRRQIQERFRQTFICEYYEKQEAVSCHFPSYTGQTKSRPWKILSPRMSQFAQESIAAFRCCHSWASVMYRGSGESWWTVTRGLHSSTATCLTPAVDIQLFPPNRRTSFLIPLKRTNFSVFSFCFIPFSHLILRKKKQKQTDNIILYRATIKTG